MQDETIAAKVKEFAAKVRSEDGVQAAVTCIEEYWVDWVQSGKIRAQVERTLDASDQAGLCSCSGFRTMRK